MLSHLDYCNAILVGLPVCRLEKLQRVQYSAARMIVSTSRFEPITPTLRALHWLPVCQRITFNIAALAFRCLIGAAPDYLIQLIAIHRPTRSLRSSSLLLLVSPLSRSKDYGDRAFSVTAPAIWNSLPCSLRLLAAYPLSTTWTNWPGKG